MTASPVTYPFGKTVPDGNAITVADGIRWLRCPLPMVLTHVNVYAIDDNGGTAVTDTGIRWDGARDFWDAFFTENRVTKILATHGHSDHLSMAGYVNEKTGALLHITREEYDSFVAKRDQTGNYSVKANVSFYRSHGLEEELAAMLLERGSFYQKTNPPLPATYRQLKDGDEITVGGSVWRVMLSSGHSENHSSYYREDGHILIGGDMMLGSILTSLPVGANDPEGDTLASFLKALDAFETLPEDTLILPAHGRVFTGLHERIRFLRNYHAARLEKLLDACRTPKTARELWDVLFEKRPNGALLVHIAMGETVAFLNHLVIRGKMSRIPDNGLFRFGTI